MPSWWPHGNRGRCTEELPHLQNPGFCQQLQEFHVVQASFENLVRAPSKTSRGVKRCTAETLGERVDPTSGRNCMTSDFLWLWGRLFCNCSRVCHSVVPMLRLSEPTGLSTPGIAQSVCATTPRRILFLTQNSAQNSSARCANSSRPTEPLRCCLCINIIGISPNNFHARISPLSSPACLALVRSRRATKSRIATSLG